MLPRINPLLRKVAGDTARALGVSLTGMGFFAVAHTVAQRVEPPATSTPDPDIKSIRSVPSRH